MKFITCLYSILTVFIAINQISCKNKVATATFSKTDNLNNPNLTSQNILSINIGEEMDSVLKLLGNPIEQRKTMGSELHNCSLPFDTFYNYYFTYKSNEINNNTAMMWVHFSSTKRVNEVYVKIYSKIKEKSIYYLTSSPCEYNPLFIYDTNELDNIKTELRLYFN